MYGLILLLDEEFMHELMLIMMLLMISNGMHGSWMNINYIWIGVGVSVYASVAGLLIYLLIRDKK